MGEDAVAKIILNEHDSAFTSSFILQNLLELIWELEQSCKVSITQLIRKFQTVQKLMSISFLKILSTGPIWLRFFYSNFAANICLKSSSSGRDKNAEGYSESTLYTYISFEDDKITFCHESWIGDRMGGDQDSGQTPSKYIAVNGEGRGGVMPAKPISIFIQSILAIPGLVI